MRQQEKINTSSQPSSVKLCTHLSLNTVKLKHSAEGTRSKTYFWLKQDSLKGCPYSGWDNLFSYLNIGSMGRYPYGIKHTKPFGKCTFIHSQITIETTIMWARRILINEQPYINRKKQVAKRCHPYCFENRETSFSAIPSPSTEASSNHCWLLSELRSPTNFIISII